MNFTFDDTQYALRDLARDLFAKESPPSRIRGMWQGKPFDRGVWKIMAEAGITGVTVPEAFGGAGGNEIDLALVYEEAGYAGLPEPLVETAGFAVAAIVDRGSDSTRERWLPAIASGDVLVAVEGPYDGHVAWADQADLLFVVREGQTHMLPRDRYRATAISTIDPARHLYTVDVDVSADTVLPGEVPARARQNALLGTAGLQNGVAMRLLEMTIEHVKDREQFGRPVGSFQAIKHKLADMHTTIASSRPAAWYSAYATATQAEDAATSAGIAKIAASESEALCNREALQCHGGIGFTWEHDLHLWLKRGIVLRSTYGTTALHRRSLAHKVLAT